ncbi:hypothetical protein MPDQ_003576 [Monascus purpureus]|uniref:Uncharacterized protein n=1 Tax=Monascus purpureus TaxID=5098 RepID=A0A507QMP2_MONPU|nr:hypothetical protein MPDQ_003576 [Monascus purpureus]BDD61321.1 hypothetical protein MAP00_006371 [Monascus purpureus]
MLLNLGLTADAAAAHDNEYSTLRPDTQLASPAPNPTSPRFSFAAIPSMAIGALYNRYTSIDAPQEPRKVYLRSMSENVAGASSLSDEESPAAALDLARPIAARRRSTGKSLSRPRTSYQLAHPPLHQRHKCLRMRPRVLLQLQQTSQTPRPIPMLDVLPSSGYRPLLAHKFPSIFRGKSGLGLQDLIIVKSELFESTVSGILDRSWASDDEGSDIREVIATICQIFKDDARAKGKVEICLNHGPTWEATPLPNGSYEFVANTPNGVQTLRWVLRAKNRRLSAPPGSLPPEDSKRFTFSVIDPSTRRHPVIATMTRNRIEVYDEYSKPAPPGTAPVKSMSSMSVVSDSSELDAPLSGNVIETDDDLRTLIVITGIWVAFREGWSRNFSYNGSSLNSSQLTSKNGSSATASRDRTASLAERPSGAPSDGGKKSPKSRNYGSLSKRSNSTGAAYIERANRRSTSVVGNRTKRSSMLSNYSDQKPNGNGNDAWNAAASPISSPRNTIDLGTRPRLTKVDFESATPVVQLERGLNGSSRQARQSQPQPAETSQEKTVKMSNGQGAELSPPKGKRRHRLSGLFDFFAKKGGHH